MPQRKQLEESPLGPYRVRGWLQRLNRAVQQHLPEQILPAHPDPLTHLSPRKREKHLLATPPDQANSLARRVLLYLLVQRGLALSLSDYDPAQDYPLNIFNSKVELEAGSNNPEYKAVASEVLALSATDLSGWTLAGLQLWQGESGRGTRKRTGSYYTPPALAAQIAERVLAEPGRTGRIVDPACGGGIFLLAALDWLAANAPGDPFSLIAGRLYGLDLNPEVVDLARLALLRRATELNNGPVSSTLLYALAHQIRPGNALIGFKVHPQGNPTGRGSKLRVQSPESRVRSPASNNEDEQQASSFIVHRSSFIVREAALAEYITTLPIFNNGAEDGRQLAALSPFDWAGEWPEVLDAGGFDAVLGNPPYVGFNDYSGVEKAYFAYAFPEIYNLKNDLLYYFIARSVEILKPGGGLGFVTSRFWKEAVFAAPLRRWLAAQTRLQLVEDFGAEQLFKEAIVDTCLLFLEKGQPAPDHSFEFGFAGRRERVLQSALDPANQGLPWAWLRRQPFEESLIAKIAAQSCLLGEVALCRTGVQTGWDEVFFINEMIAAGLEPDLLHRAIKSGEISPGRIILPNLYLIYPPLGLDETTYPLLMNYLEPYREKLLRRLRYETAFPHYQLQWPRRPEVFEVLRKLVTPYKARRNTFALDCAQLYFSTDVISVVFEATSPLLRSKLEQFAQNFLNSRLSTFQFRSYSKPVGGGQYDYYANPVKKLALPRCAFAPKPANAPLLQQLAQPNLSQNEIDFLVYQLYELNEAEIKLIERSVI